MAVVVAVMTVAAVVRMEMIMVGVDGVDGGRVGLDRSQTHQRAS